MVSRMAHEAAHAVELLVAREDQVATASLAPAFVLLDKLVNELANEVEYAVPSPDPLPKIIGGET